MLVARAGWLIHQLGGQSLELFSLIKNWYPGSAQYTFAFKSFAQQQRPSTLKSRKVGGLKGSKFFLEGRPQTKWKG